MSIARQRLTGTAHPTNVGLMSDRSSCPPPLTKSQPTAVRIALSSMHSPLWTRAGELDAELLVATSSASLSSHTGQSERSYAGRPRAARTVTIGRRVRIEERTSRDFVTLAELYVTRRRAISGHRGGFARRGAADSATMSSSGSRAHGRLATWVSSGRAPRTGRATAPTKCETESRPATTSCYEA